MSGRRESNKEMRPETGPAAMIEPRMGCLRDATTPCGAREKIEPYYTCGQAAGAGISSHATASESDASSLLHASPQRRKVRPSTMMAPPLLLLLLLLLPRGVASNGDDLKALVGKMNRDVLSLRDAIESGHGTRCTSGSVRTCQGSSYDECLSAYPNTFCPAADFAVIEDCGTGLKCNGLFDDTVSTVRIPSSVDKETAELEPHVVDTVCYTRALEQWARSKTAEDKQFWAKLGVPSPWMYFGAQDGVFRIYPARQSRECGQYDPRKRPWYIASVPEVISETTGSRDVVLVIDTSQSMGTDGALDRAKFTARTVLRTLSPLDRVAVVQFGELAAPIYDLVPATPDNVKRLVSTVDGLNFPNGRSNWMDAFRVTFDVLDRADLTKDPTDCDGPPEAAIIFLTDGRMNVPAGATGQDLIDYYMLRQDGTEKLRGGDAQVMLFAYTIGDDLDPLPKNLSCAAGGFWQRVKTDDTDQDLEVEAMEYQKIFAKMLGEDRYRNLTEWTGPYLFTTSQKDGYTVSALAFDRSLDPPHFLGAVGMDVQASAVRFVYDLNNPNVTEEGAEEAIRRIIHERIDMLCDRPKPWDECAKESFRFAAFGGGQEAMCNPPNCTAELPKECAGLDEFTRMPWQNLNDTGKSYNDRVCCRVGESVPSNQCPFIEVLDENALSRGATLGIILGTLVFFQILICYFCYDRTSEKGNVS